MSHAILVVHGVGDNQKTDTLRQFSNGFIEFLYQRLTEQKIDPNTLQLKSNLNEDQPEIRLTLTHAGQVEDFIVRSFAPKVPCFAKSPFDKLRANGFSYLRSW